MSYAEDTEKLETELRDLSTRLEADKLRFQQVRGELAARHAKGGDQPPPRMMTEDQMRQELRDAAARQDGALINKLIAMELEQAKLVVEAEVAKAAAKEAQDRLTLIAKVFKTNFDAAEARIKEALGTQQS
jgi:hypothetical protein